MLASVLVVVPVVVVVATLAVVVGEVDLPAEQWLRLTLVILAGSIPIELIGLIVGLAFRFEAAQAAQAVAFVLLAFLGGAFAQSDEVPGALEEIVYLSPSYYLVELARHAVGAEASVGLAIAALIGSTVVLTAVVVALRRRTV